MDYSPVDKGQIRRADVSKKNKTKQQNPVLRSHEVNKSLDGSCKTARERMSDPPALNPSGSRSL